MNSLIYLPILLPNMRPHSFTFIKVTRRIVRVFGACPRNIFHLVVQISFRHRFTTNLFRHRIVSRLVRTLHNTNRPMISNNSKVGRLTRSTNLFVRFTRDNLLQNLTFLSVPLQRTPFRVTKTKVANSGNRTILIVRGRATYQVFTCSQRFLNVR